MKRDKGSCFLIATGMLVLGGFVGTLAGMQVATQKCAKKCEADLAICKMGRETRQQQVESATQELNQCKQQIKRMR